MGAANSAPHGVSKMLSGAELASCPLVLSRSFFKRIEELDRDAFVRH